MRESEIQAMIGCLILKAEVIENQSVSFETDKNILKIESSEGGAPDEGDAVLDSRNLKPQDFVGSTILGITYIENAVNEHLSFPENSDLFDPQWELFDIETTLGNLKIWFCCSDGGYSHGSAYISIQSKQ